MAFFKFRQSNASPAKTSPRTTEAATAAATETVEALRRRARHRLIGAVVLVLAAVIGFPLLFDTQPRPVAINAPITIPDRDSAAPLAAPKAADVAAPASLGEREEVVPPVPAARLVDKAQPPAAVRTSPDDDAKAKSAREDEVRAKAARDDEVRAKAKRDEQAKAKHEADARKQREDAARARAALAASSSAKPAASAAAGDAGRFIVQIGAFAEPDKVQEARQKAERAGLKTYTQVVDTKDGKRTRVRVGPFASRAEAEKAADVLKKAGLSGGIFSL